MKIEFKKALFWLGVMITLTACTSPSLTKEQCLTGNWEAIGYNDGVAGYYPDRINVHQEACAKTGIIPNFTLWEKGRENGLKHYCTIENATRLGNFGYAFNRVCPNAQTENLQNVYNKAYQKYTIRRQLAQDKRTLSQHKEKLAKLLKGEMLDFKTEKEAREYMLKLQKEILALEQKIRKAERTK
ncbi:DUF2799 domain-containing protein [Pasteurella atlantica]|uniref:DUF2799 domain-containing protein n=1 Tax=Pasteurellaceae TaxID=712 RepID=UPI0027471294|nr:DUF2799 domain-containing protein [Pasteurella atlantica]MDP8033365.1 DUF2799 domain-containing protein [Pasteurella atlantica]MDP8035301.1 DUF2799 domain-containing protein [Pasteurella atlantica]MDP8037251.1 DUF2799 domain-containing protein [Pasteurella atlantica]MDP8047635.1 DUF2799 domain-containing protein [Pasteurella atlantica]MDP8049554.1 DUF2799 domain-containing protein [Pasteurella atlantica]